MEIGGSHYEMGTWPIDGLVTRYEVITLDFSGDPGTARNRRSVSSPGIVTTISMCKSGLLEDGMVPSDGGAGRARGISSI